MRKLLIYIFFCLLTVCQFASCREDELISYAEEEQTGEVPQKEGFYSGLYLLNEGNMGSNHCTLDYLDLTTSTYHRNIYAERNPSSVKELGDVGNDLQIYGGKLWMVINCSNKVEVCHLKDATRIGQINIPNCRYITFDEGYAYVSSFVGPVSLTAKAQQGRIYKVDTLSLQKVDSAVVGFQPEEVAIMNGRLYTANSGGYLLPTYSNTVSQVNLTTMREERQITVGCNPHRLETDRYGSLWVSTRGNYADIAPALYCLSPTLDGSLAVSDILPIAVSDMQMVGDTLWYFGANWNAQTQTIDVQYGMIDVRTHRLLDTHIFDAPEIQQITTPYGLLVNPREKDFYLMDAKNYVSSGQLLHFAADGTCLSKMRTGDIPSRAVLNPLEHFKPLEPVVPPSPCSPYLAAVDEYVPAPGQFVNALPLYEEGDDALSMARKCTEAIANNAGGLVTLGGFGGYLTFHFESPVLNLASSADFRIYGNANASSSEPGIVQVSMDLNGNGLPDDEWYELAGSADIDSIGLMHYDYEISYQLEPLQDTPWQDNLGRQGLIPRNSFHKQEYFPLWLDSPLSFRGTLLPPNGYDQSGKGTYWVTTPLRYGYVDNVPNSHTEGCSFDLDWAVDPRSRQKVYLSHADFIRVYSAQNQVCGWLGETSTEISGAEIIRK